MEHPAPVNASRLTQSYVRERPSIRECLERGLINYSALAREICSHHQITSFDAVLIACRRLHERSRPSPGLERRIVSLIRKAKVRVRNKVVVATVEKGGALERALQLQELIRKEKGDFNLIEGEDVFTIVTTADYLPALKKAFGARIIKIGKELVQIIMIFPEQIQSTPGVVSYLYRLFAENGINIREEMSCWTDLMVIIDERDLLKAMQVLNF